MAATGWLQIIFTLLAIFLLSIPMGRYMARIVMSQKTRAVQRSIQKFIKNRDLRPPRAAA